MEQERIESCEEEGPNTTENQRDFFGLWSAVTEACGEGAGDAPFDQVCDQIFKNEYFDGKEAVNWLFEELAKIQDQKFRERMMDAAINLTERFKYFYLMAGYALGKDYDVSKPDARDQIEYLRKRIREAGIFTMPAKAR